MEPSPSSLLVAQLVLPAYSLQPTEDTPLRSYIRAYFCALYRKLSCQDVFFLGLISPGKNALDGTTISHFEHLLLHSFMLFESVFLGTCLERFR
jgi:hypothetical protein